MALRAGYKGFKKLLPGLKIIRPGTLGIDNGVLIPELNKTFFSRSEQAVLGAKNLLTPQWNTASGTERNGVTCSYNNDRIITLSGTASAATDFDIKRRTINNNASDFYLPIGRYKYTVGKNKPSSISLSLATTYNGSYKAIPFKNYGDYIEFEIAADTQSDYKLSDGSVLVGVYIAIANGTDTTGMKLYPMILLASDTDISTYKPFVMTNKELMEKKYNKPVTVKNVDLNSLTETGIYTLDGGLTNSPSGNLGVLEVVIMNEGIRQIYYPFGTSEYMYLRRFWDGAWDSWYKFQGTIVS